MLGIGRDEDDVPGSELGDASGAVELDVTVEDDEGLGLARMEVGAHRLVGLRRHLAEAPSPSGFLRRDPFSEGGRSAAGPD